MRLPAGTQTPDALAYTAEQRAALATMLDDRYELGIARAEFVNHCLHPDGTISDDLSLVRQAVLDRGAEAAEEVARAQAILNAGSNAVLRASAKDKAAARQAFDKAQQEYAALLQQQLAATRMPNEVELHVEENRFLFVLGENGLPAIYFQCATADNPDLPRRKGAKATKTAKRAKGR
jgi:hypothetical protein